MLHTLFTHTFSLYIMQRNTFVASKPLWPLNLYLCDVITRLCGIIEPVCVPCALTDHYDMIIAANRIENPEKRMLKVKKVLHELPDHNFETFRFLAQHLSRVASKGDINKVGPSWCSVNSFGSLRLLSYSSPPVPFFSNIFYDYSSQGSK